MRTKKVSLSNNSLIKMDRKNIQSHIPTCYIIAGPNGSGKTTFAMTYFRKLRKCNNFINADLIASGLSPLNPESAAIEAGKIFIREIENNIQKRINFAFETTLSGKSYLKTIKCLKEDSWRVELIFLWIPSAIFSSMRVKERVSQGGHNIPEEAIRRRFPRSISNLLTHYSKYCDSVFCYDNSGIKPELIFERDEKGTRIENARIFKLMKRIADDR